MDNIKNNDMFIHELETLLEKCDIPFNAKDQQVQCLSHTLDVCTGHVVDMLTNTELTEVAMAWPISPQDLSNRQTYQEVLSQNPITLGHNIVQASHSSDLWWDEFKNYIKEGNEQNYWNIQHNDGRVKEVKINVIQFICDVEMWWGSAFHAVHHLQYLKCVSTNHFAESGCFVLTLSSLSMGLLNYQKMQTSGSTSFPRWNGMCWRILN